MCLILHQQVYLLIISPNLSIEAFFEIEVNESDFPSLSVEFIYIQLLSNRDFKIQPIQPLSTHILFGFLVPLIFLILYL